MGRLFIIGTPIGNRGDLSPRATEVLRSVSVIFCEDTRVSRKLLEPLAIAKQLNSIHHHSSDSDLDHALELMENGDAAYIADAGTPGVSDPGGRLVARARARGVGVFAVPGPSSVTAALSVAGLPAERFRMFGFLPHKKGRQTLLREVAGTEETVVLFEAPTRLVRVLKELTPLVEDRPLVVCRELTKSHESVRSGTADAMREYFEQHPDECRGEIVIVLAPRGWQTHG